jgi:hypothetical protein
VCVQGAVRKGMGLLTAALAGEHPTHIAATGALEAASRPEVVHQHVQVAPLVHPAAPEQTRGTRGVMKHAVRQGRKGWGGGGRDSCFPEREVGAGEGRLQGRAGAGGELQHKLQMCA